MDRERYKERSEDPAPRNPRSFVNFLAISNVAMILPTVIAGAIISPSTAYRHFIRLFGLCLLSVFMVRRHNWARLFTGVCAAIEVPLGLALLSTLQGKTDLYTVWGIVLTIYSAFLAYYLLFDERVRAYFHQSTARTPSFFRADQSADSGIEARSTGLSAKEIENPALPDDDDRYKPPGERRQKPPSD